MYRYFLADLDLKMYEYSRSSERTVGEIACFSTW